MCQRDAAAMMPEPRDPPAGPPPAPLGRPAEGGLAPEEVIWTPPAPPPPDSAEMRLVAIEQQIRNSGETVEVLATIIARVEARCAANAKRTAQTAKLCGRLKDRPDPPDPRPAIRAIGQRVDGFEDRFGRLQDQCAGIDAAIHAVVVVASRAEVRCTRVEVRCTRLEETVRPSFAGGDAEQTRKGPHDGLADGQVWNPPPEPPRFPVSPGVQLDSRLDGLEARCAENRDVIRKIAEACGLILQSERLD